jgi:hypothetical protein
MVRPLIVWVGSLLVAAAMPHEKMTPRDPASHSDERVFLSVGIAWDPAALPLRSLSNRFRIFREARRADNRPPAEVMRLADGLAGPTEDSAVDADDAPGPVIPDSGLELLRDDEFGVLYAFETENGHVCYVSDSGAGSCVDQLTHGLSLSWSSEGTEAKPVQTHIFGLADDSIRRIMMKLRENEELEAPVENNGFYLKLPAGMGFTDIERCVVTRHDGRTYDITLNT